MLQYIIEDMGEALRYLPYGMVVGVVVVVFLNVVNSIRKKKQKPLLRVIPYAFLFMYLAIVVFITYLSREGGSSQKIDFNLFSTWGINERNNAFVIENVLLFIPYGYICAWALKAAKSIWGCALIGLLTSVGIECMQFVTERGMFQIDDILTNLFGAIIGYIIYRLVTARMQRTEMD